MSPIRLSKHLLSFNRQLFLSVIALFVAFVICFIAFQYRREKDYKVELLNTQLQNYNDRMHRRSTDKFTFFKS